MPPSQIMMGKPVTDYMVLKGPDPKKNLTVDISSNVIG